MPGRRFPPPWSVEEQDACFVVRDHNRRALGYVYFEDEPGPGAAPDTDACRGDGRTVTVDCDHRRVAMLRLAFFRGRGLP